MVYHALNLFIDCVSFACLLQLRDEIAKRFFHIQQVKTEGIRSLLDHGKIPTNERANVILVGPIPKTEAQHVVTVHWLLKMMIEHKLVDNECYLVTVRPCRVENEAVEFEEFTPAW